MTEQALDLATIQDAVRASFARDTCSVDDLPYWSTDNPSRGHCAVAAMVVHDFLGGRLVQAEVWRGNEQFGYHYWNRLPGVDIDLTGDQFLPHEAIRSPRVIERDPDRPTIYDSDYGVFKERVLGRLSTM